MSDPVIKAYIRDVLEKGPITAPTDGRFRTVAGLTGFSNNAVLRALGSMIGDGEVARRRPSMLDRGGNGRPVTWSLTALGRERLKSDRQAVYTADLARGAAMDAIITEVDEAVASLVVWVNEAKRRRFAPSWSELCYRSGLMAHGWVSEEVMGLVLQLSDNGVFRLRQLANGGLVLRPSR